MTLCLVRVIFYLENFAYRKKISKNPGFRLWTFPVLVDGPFGVVSATELIGIVLFSMYIIWAVSAYIVQDFNNISKFQPTLKDLWYMNININVKLLWLIINLLLILAECYLYWFHHKLTSYSCYIVPYQLMEGEREDISGLHSIATSRI